MLYWKDDIIVTSVQTPFMEEDKHAIKIFTWRKALQFSASAK